MNNEKGFMEGELCNREGCEGIIKRSGVENCYCHINPPCGKCTDPSLEYCPTCDWDGSEE